jgi:hypothetical protein
MIRGYRCAHPGSSASHPLLRLDAAGTVRWYLGVTNFSSSVFASAAETTDGGLVVAGHFFSDAPEAPAGFGLNDYWVVKLSNDDTPATLELAVDGYDNAGPRLSVRGRADVRFAVDFSPTLGSCWHPLSTNRTVGGTAEIVDDTASGVAQRFYRTRLVP